MDIQLKKEIRNHSIQIALGILIMIPFINDKSWLRFISLGGFLLAIVNVLWFVIKSELILYNLFPTKTIREEKTKLNDQIWNYISIFLFFSGLVFLIVQMYNIENIIEESDFWKNYSLIGFSISLLSLLVLYKLRASIFDESGRRYSVIFGFVLGMTSLSVSISSFINKKYSQNEITEKTYTIERMSIGGKKKNNYWIFINIDESEKRFQIKPKLWYILKKGDEIRIKLKKGYLDYEFNTEIKPVANTMDKT